MRRFFACDNVVSVADREAFDFHMPTPGVFKTLSAVRCENEVQVEWANLQLHEVAPAFDILLLTWGQGKSQVVEACDEGAAVTQRALHKDVGIPWCQESPAGPRPICR